MAPLGTKGPLRSVPAPVARIDQLTVREKIAGAKQFGPDRGAPPEAWLLPRVPGSREIAWLDKANSWSLSADVLGAVAMELDRRGFSINPSERQSNSTQPETVMNEIKQLTEEFIKNVSRVVEVGLRNTVLSALGTGKGYDYSLFTVPAVALKPGLFERKARRKGPVQLCPIRNCPRRAAPVFGMVCAVHKDVPKSKIKAAREARRRAKTA